MGRVGAWLRRICLNVTLVASNVLFFGLASWLLTWGSRIRKAGWLDAFEDDYPWFHTLYVLMVIFLSTIVAAMALSGLYSIFFRRKEWVLWVYGVSTILAALLCLALVIEGSISVATARSWSSRPIADPEIEGTVRDSFNSIYCLSEAAYLCTAPANAQWLVHFGSDDLRDMFLDPHVASAIKAAMGAERRLGGRNLLQLCEDESSVLHAPQMDRQVANLCTWCGGIANLKAYVHLVAWANTKCPPKPGIAGYCVREVWPTATDVELDGTVRIFYPEDPGTAVDAPYMQCRRTFVSYWLYLSVWFLVAAGLLFAFMLAVIRMAWIVLRPKRERYTDWHGRQPERRPLVQVTSPSNAPKLTTTSANSTERVPPTKKPATKAAASKAK